MTSGLRRLLTASLPPLRTAVLGSAAWAIVIGGSAGVELVRSDAAAGERLTLICAIYAAGALVAFAPALFVGRLLSRGRSEAAFAATLLALSVGTIGAVGLLFAVDYRLYYAQWHEPAFSPDWVRQFIFTTAAAFYQYLVIGLRLYVPVGLVALFAASLWNARATR